MSFEGKIIVRTYNNSASKKDKHRSGFMFKALKQGLFKESVYYEQGCSLKPSSFRLATDIEIDAFTKGVRNVLTPELVKGVVYKHNNGSIIMWGITNSAYYINEHGAFCTDNGRYSLIKTRYRLATIQEILLLDSKRNPYSWEDCSKNNMPEVGEYIISNRSMDGSRRVDSIHKVADGGAEHEIRYMDLNDDFKRNTVLSTFKRRTVKLNFNNKTSKQDEKNKPIKQEQREISSGTAISSNRSRFITAGERPVGNETIVKCKKTRTASLEISANIIS